MNLFAYFHAELVGALKRLAESGKLPPGLDLGKIAVEPPRDPAHGDVSTNAAMVLAKPAGLAPRAIAELLAEMLRGHPAVTEVSIAGPGFLNWRLADGFWRDRLGELLAAGADYGNSTIGGGAAVNVEYVSANPTGPMHVGHCRG